MKTTPTMSRAILVLLDDSLSAEGAADLAARVADQVGGRAAALPAGVAAAILRTGGGSVFVINAPPGQHGPRDSQDTARRLTGTSHGGAG